MRIIDLRSDTVTNPTEAMREAMKNAVCGDDVYGDDPTVSELEKISAEITGKEASVFVPSGTFGNQLAVMSHTKSGDEVILDDMCHIVQHEAGAAAIISRVQLRTVESDWGAMNPKTVESKIRAFEDIHYPSTGLICVENAHSNGRVISLDVLEGIYAAAKKHSVPVHMDGARLFNAAAALKTDAKEITKFCDSVMFCLSKGLCAPVGSILAGSEKFIEKARKNRKILGGGLRQAGVLAAPGIIAVGEMTERLHEDHKNAELLRSELKKIRGIKVDDGGIQINMAYFDISETGCEPDKLVAELLKRGIKINGEDGGLFRLVTHYWITEEDVLATVNAVKEVINL